MSTTEQTTTTKSNTPPPNPDAAMLVGGPAGDHGQSMPAQGTPHPDTTQVKYELNGKSFNSAEDMSRYVADLEKKVIEQPTITHQTIPVQPTEQVELVDGLPVDQAIFTNPAKVLKYFEQKVQTQFDQRLMREEAKKEFWQNFYTTNPDLKGKEELVQALVAKNRGDWEKMKLPDFSKVVSENTRSTLQKLGVSNATEVRQTDAATLSTSGTTAPVIQMPRRETSFVDEMNAAKQKRKSAKVK